MYRLKKNQYCKVVSINNSYLEALFTIYRLFMKEKK